MSLSFFRQPRVSAGLTEKVVAECDVCEPVRKKSDSWRGSRYASNEMKLHWRGRILILHDIPLMSGAIPGCSYRWLAHHCGWKRCVKDAALHYASITPILRSLAACASTGISNSSLEAFYER